jgi:hypothetical protein
MRRFAIAGLLVVFVVAGSLGTGAGAARTTLTVKPGESQIFAHVFRGDVVMCGSLHLTIQRTPMVLHIKGETRPVYPLRAAYGGALTLTMSSRQPHIVSANCKRH